jgi:hypothetical protein
MNRTILLFLFSLGTFSLQAQSIFFPKTWIGQWKGTLQVAANNGSVNNVSMQLILENSKKPNQYYFTIVYSNGGKDDVRSYTLISDTLNPGHYLMDEGNGIKINEYLFGTTLISQFVVEGQLLTAIYSFEREQIRFRIISANASPAGTTGGKDKIPIVQDFEIMAYQEAILTKVK